MISWIKQNFRFYLSSEETEGWQLYCYQNVPNCLQKFLWFSPFVTFSNIADKCLWIRFVSLSDCCLCTCLLSYSPFSNSGKCTQFSMRIYRDIQRNSVKLWSIWKIICGVFYFCYDIWNIIRLKNFMANDVRWLAILDDLLNI